MLVGTYKHNLDPAGRLVVPLELRDELTPTFYITRGIRCLVAFTSEWKRKIDEELSLAASPMTQLLNTDVSKLHRHFFSGMTKVTVDKQNRIQLPAVHRTYAGIIDAVTICGCGEYAELWNTGLFEQLEQDVTGLQDMARAGAMLFPLPGRRQLGEGDAGVPSAGPA
jgi:MraZ protein